jgi:hypothetical protein
MTARSERGSATLTAVLAAALAAALGVTVISLVMAVAMRIELETAADAAALAAVGAAVSGDDPHLAARRLAMANGARLGLCRCPAFDGEAFVSTVEVFRVIELPLIGERVIAVERSAEYSVGP